MQILSVCCSRMSRKPRTAVSLCQCMCLAVSAPSQPNWLAENSETVNFADDMKFWRRRNFYYLSCPDGTVSPSCHGGMEIIILNWALEKLDLSCTSGRLKLMTFVIKSQPCLFLLCVWGTPVSILSSDTDFSYQDQLSSPSQMKILLSSHHMEPRTIW